MYEARIGTAEESFYTFIVRIEKDGYENVLHGYKGRTFKSKAAAEKSVAKYLAKKA